MLSRRKILQLIFSLSAVCAALFFMSCNAIEDALGLEEPSLSVSISSPASASEDYGYRVADIATCRVDIYRNSGKLYSGYTASGSSISLDVSKGSYSVYAYAYDSVGTYIAKGNGHATVDNGEESITVQLVWDVAEKQDGEKVTVKFNTNGGTLTSETTVEIKSGETVSKPSDPIRLGYNFDGWYATSDFSESFDFSTEITYNRTIYAKWTGDGITNELYVSSSGDDETGVGSESAPFATLQRAITKIQELSDSTADYTIHVSGTVTGNTEIPASALAKTILIQGTNSSSDKLDGNATSNVVRVTTTVPIIFKNISIENGLAGSDGGGAGISLKSGANVILDSGAVVQNNTTTWKDETEKKPKNGGGIFVNEGATLTMYSGSSIKNNKSYGRGGGVNLNKDATFNMLGGEISGNSAGIEDNGVIYGGNGGGIRIGENCTFKMTGGSITNNSSLTNAGGIFTIGTVTIEGSESSIIITGNWANKSGGAIFASGGTVTVNENVTIGSNTAQTSGGAFFINGSCAVTINGGSIFGNTSASGGGAFNVSTDGILKIYGGTIMNNTAPNDSYSNGISSAGSLTLGGNAQIDSSNGIRLNNSSTITIESDLASSSVATIRPSAYTLGAQVLSGTSAILSANYEKFTLVPRDENSDWFIKEDGTLGCTTGAELIVYVYESGDDDSGTGTQSAPFATLARAVKYFNEYSESADLSKAQCVAYLSGTIRGTTTIDTQNIKRLRIRGQRNATLDGNSSGSVVTVETTVPVNFNNLTITNGNTSGNGGGIKITNSSTVRLESGVVISGNTASANGGGVWNSGSNLIIDGAEISGNTTEQHGGGIYNCSDAKLELNSGTVSGNTATENGGGVYNANVFTMNGGTISGNSAKNGAGIYNGGTFEMSAGTISANTATSNGGGVYNEGTMFMYGSAVVGDSSKNATATESSYSNKGDGIYTTGTVYLGYSDASTTATLTGGIYYNSGSGVSILNGTVHMNSGTIAYNYVRGVYAGSNDFQKYGTFTMDNGTISGNGTAATENGGGIYAGYHGKITMNDGTISGNKAKNGGGLDIANNYSYFTMTGGTISSNTATENGGGVYSDMASSYTGSITMSGGTISGNSAATGKGVYIKYGPFTMSGSALISSNNDTYLESGTYITVDGTLSESTAATITPQSYTAGTQVLSGSAVSSEYTKFALTPKTGEIWSIGSDGKLVQSVSSGISITTPTYTNDDLELTQPTESGTNYVFTAKAGYDSYIWTVNGKVYNTGSTNTVTIPKAELLTTNRLLLVATDSSGNANGATVDFTVTN